METTWLVIGFTAQLLFSARFLVQWIASERARKSVVPLAFWFLSLAGGGLLLSYAIWRKDPVFILGQTGGLIVYFRNLHLIFKEKRDKKSIQESTTIPKRDGLRVQGVKGSRGPVVGVKKEPKDSQSAQQKSGG
ncbi:MAG: lipid A biosynthesis acyltransferase [Deltaproteobacteria bacterium]|nr:lipid A biosynthesis acyltransferase [Deltaproteobacteria bacterium]